MGGGGGCLYPRGLTTGIFCSRYSRQMNPYPGGGGESLAYNRHFMVAFEVAFLIVKTSFLHQIYSQKVPTFEF